MANVNRREALIGGAAATLSFATAAGPLGARELSRVPEVDALTLHVIVDNATFGPFLPDMDLPGLRVVRGRERPAARLSRKTLMAEFGLSILGESTRGSETKRVLVDFGYTPEVLSNNLNILDLNPASFDASVLSHGHLDHYGGHSALFGKSSAHRKRLPLFVGGEETFCERIGMIGTPPPVMGALDRQELARAGLDARIKPEPAVVAGHAFTTGIIPLETAERAAIPTAMRPGIGCSIEALPPKKRSLAELPDDGEHELATCYAVKGLGLVVIASCSHRGVINSIKRAQAISRIQKVHAVVGGFHLVRPRTEDEARQTVAELVRIDPSYVVPMHCSGDLFTAEAMRLMPQKVIKPYVGTRLTFQLSSRLAPMLQG